MVEPSLVKDCLLQLLNCHTEIMNNEKNAM